MRSPSGRRYKTLNAVGIVLCRGDGWNSYTSVVARTELGSVRREVLISAKIWSVVLPPPSSHQLSMSSELDQLIQAGHDM